MGDWILPALSLTRREVVRFLRQRSRVIGAVGTPLLFWALLGTGLNHSFSVGGDMSYLRYFYPGTIVMTLLFTAIFSTISIIEDRREGFLQAVLVSPAPRLAVVLGKLLGGTLLATLQGLVFLLLSPLLGIHFGIVSFLAVLAVMFFLSFGLTGLGFVIAWRLDSSQGFHAVMNLFLMPLWFLSGSVFPVTGAPGWLKALMMINPLTYGVAALHEGLYAGLHTRPPFPSFAVCLGVTIFFAALMAVLSLWVAQKTEKSA